MIDLKTLGFSATYRPGFPLAPEPKALGLRTSPPLSFIRPGRRTGDVPDGPEGAVAGGVVAALVQLDHFARRAYDMGFFKKTSSSSWASWCSRAIRCSSSMPASTTAR